MAEEIRSAPNDSPAEKPDSTEAEVNLDDIDQLIRAEDPEFEKSLKEVSAVENAGVDLADSSIEIEDELLSEKAEELSEPAKKPGIFQRWRVALIEKGERTRKWLREIPRNAWPFSKRLVVGMLKGGIGLVKKVVHGFSEFIDYLYHMSGLEKLIVLAIIALSVAIFQFVKFTLAGKVIPLVPDIYLRSYEDVADHVYTFGNDEPFQDFFNAVNEPHFFVSLDKMVVNLRRSESSTENPMGAFKFFLEGSSQEVAVEIKMREREIRDLIQRRLEQSTYDLLRMPEGKMYIKAAIRQEVNGILNEGQVRRVLIDSIILKP